MQFRSIHSLIKTLNQVLSKKNPHQSLNFADGGGGDKAKPQTMAEEP